MNIGFRGKIHPPEIGESPQLDTHLPAFRDGINQMRQQVTEKMTSTGAVVIQYEPDNQEYQGFYFKEQDGFPSAPNRVLNALNANYEQVVKFIKDLGNDAVLALPYGSAAVAFSGSTNTANPFQLQQ